MLILKQIITFVQNVAIIKNVPGDLGMGETSSLEGKPGTGDS